MLYKVTCSKKQSFKQIVYLEIAITDFIDINTLYLNQNGGLQMPIVNQLARK